MTHKDPTFWAVYALERKEQVERARMEQCGTCKYKGKKIHGTVWLCNLKKLCPKDGFCSYWRPDEKEK